MELPRPVNCKSDVLFTLLVNGSASIIEHPKLSGFRTRISELSLKHGVIISSINEKGVNKFGSSITYKRHFLAPEHIEEAKTIYYTINKSN